MRPVSLMIAFISILSFITPVLGASPRACMRYAQEAVAQLRQAQSLGLPTPSPVWSSNYQQHYDWCLGQTEQALSQGRALRQAPIDKAKASSRPVVSTPAMTGSIIKAAPVQNQHQVKVATAVQQNNSQACNRYAAESVRQNQVNRRLGAGFTGPAWSGNSQAHQRWCLQGKNVQTTPGHLQRREKMLQAFSIKNGKDAARRYAEESVRQNAANKAMKAGYSPPVWSSNFNAHYQWSKTGNNLAATPGHLANRERMLQEAAIKKQPGSTAVAKPMQTTGKRAYLIPVQHLQQLKRINSGPDPFVVAFMHTLEKSLGGAMEYSQIEQIMLRGIKQLPKVRQQQLMDKWQAIPSELRIAATPPSLRGISATDRLTISIFSKSLVESAKASEGIKVMQLHNTALPGSGSTTNLSLLLKSGTVFVANAPVINGFNPKSSDGPFVRVGDHFTLFGKNFSSDTTKVKIHFLQKIGNKYELAGTVYPQKASSTELQSTAIASGLSGRSNRATRIIVEVDGKFSAPYNVIVARPLAPSPSIASVSPQGGYPGNRLIVDGQDFTSPLEMYVRGLNQQASTYRPQSHAFQATPTLLNDKQFVFQIPQDTWSGHYKFNVRADNSGFSNYKLFDVKPPRYRMVFNKIHCIDESDPEWPNNDSIVTAWVVIADDVVWSKGTGEYKSFEDNTKRNYTVADGLIVPAPGEKWESIQDFLYVQTSLYEIDSGDVKAWASGVSSVSNIAAGVSTALGAIFGNPEAGKIAGDIIKTIGDGLSKLINWIGGDNDFLGSQTVSWTAPELQMKTASSSSFSDQMPFMNNDDTGSYNVSFTIFRHKEY